MKCPECKGKRVIENRRTCPVCTGSGRIPSDDLFEKPEAPHERNENLTDKIDEDLHEKKK